MTDTPTIMVACMVKNASQWLPQSWSLLKSLTYPKEKLHLVYTYGRSGDNTLELIKSYAREGIIEVEIYNEPPDPGLKKYGAAWSAGVYNDWKEILDEDYLLLFDSDIIDAPSNLIEELLKVNGDIVAPYPYVEGERYFYDSWIWRLNNYRFHPNDPPGRHLKVPVKVDSVGTCFLAKRSVYLRVPIDNPYPNLTFSNNARKMGYSVVGCPYLKIIHKDVLALGYVHSPLDPQLGGYPRPEWADSRFPIQAYGTFTVEEIQV